MREKRKPYWTGRVERIAYDRALKHERTCIRLLDRRLGTTLTAPSERFELA